MELAQLILLIARVGLELVKVSVPSLSAPGIFAKQVTIIPLLDKNDSLGVAFVPYIFGCLVWVTFGFVS